MIGGTKVGRGSQEIVLATKSYGEVELRDQERWSYLVGIEHLERTVPDRRILVWSLLMTRRMDRTSCACPTYGLTSFCPLGTPA